MKRNLHHKKPRAASTRKPAKQPPLVAKPKAKPQFESVVDALAHIKQKDKKITRNDLLIVHSLCKVSLEPVLEIRHLIENNELIKSLTHIETKLVVKYATECKIGYGVYSDMLEEIYSTHKHLKGDNNNIAMMFDALDITNKYGEWLDDVTENLLNTHFRSLINLLSEKEESLKEKPPIEVTPEPVDETTEVTLN